MRTLVLLHVLNSGRQEHEETTRKDMRLATQASASAVNPDIFTNYSKCPKKPQKTPVGIYISIKVAMFYSEYDLNRVNTGILLCL